MSDSDDISQSRRTESPIEELWLAAMMARGDREFRPIFLRGGAILRFTGSEIFNDARACVEQVYDWAAESL